MFRHALIAPVLALALAGGASAGAASLWPPAEQPQRSMFADRKAGSKGDVLTIVVAESAVSQTSQSKSTSRESSVQDALQQFLFPGRGSHRGAMPAIGATGQSSFSGSGDVSNSQRLSARAAVTVIDVLPNGLLVVEGMRVVTFSGETQYVVLRGVVRPDDVGRDNTVVSTDIADARVEFHSKGSLSDAQQRGWLSKVYEKLRPF